MQRFGVLEFCFVLSVLTVKQQQEWDAKEIFPRDVLKQLGSLGFGAIYAREEHGGSGLSRVSAATIFEALSTACVSTTAYLSIHNMCAWMIDAYGSNEQRAHWIPKLASMDALASYCLTGNSKEL
jgi:alkylation response protein AidB-like acyl-CoA dehydrogenase